MDVKASKGINDTLARVIQFKLLKMKNDNSKETDYIDPDKNVLSLFDTDILVAVVNGKIDLNKAALRELKNRGLDSNGKWVGFK